MSGHACRYRDRVVWSDWMQHGALRERTARRVPICDGCGREQPARHPRPPFLREEEAASPEHLPLLDEAGRVVADVLSRQADRGDRARVARGLLSRMAARGVTGSLAESWLEQFMRAGLVRLRWRQLGHQELRAVRVLDTSALEELAHPGDRVARAEAITAANALLEGLDHPVVAEARRVLGEEGHALSPDLARALAAVARHAAQGDALAERVFSARHLGSSKALGRLRGTIERRLGPLEGLGIREGGALTLVGGRGRLLIPGAMLDLVRLGPYVGLARQAALGLEGIEPPPPGIVAVENLAVFEACCRGEVRELAGAMYVWTAGYPGRGVRAIIEAAARAGAAVRAWCDSDLDGVRIARIVAGWAPGCEFHRMSADDLVESAQRRPLAEGARRAIERELERGTADGLTATLRAMLAVDGWLEQETLLGEHR